MLRTLIKTGMSYPLTFCVQNEQIGAASHYEGRPRSSLWLQVISTEGPHFPEAHVEPVFEDLDVSD